MKKKNITINQLARMMQRGFDGVDEGFNKVDARFDKIEKQLKNFREKNSLEHEDIKLGLSQVAYRFELEEIDKRLKKVGAKVGLK